MINYFSASISGIKFIDIN